MYCTNWFVFSISMLWVDYRVAITKGCCPYFGSSTWGGGGEEMLLLHPRGWGLLWVLALQGFAEPFLSLPRAYLKKSVVLPGQAPCAGGLCGQRAGGPGVGSAAQVSLAGAGQASWGDWCPQSSWGASPGPGLANHRVSEPFPRGLGTDSPALCWPWPWPGVAGRAWPRRAPAPGQPRPGGFRTQRLRAGCWLLTFVSEWVNKKGTLNVHLPVSQVITCSTAMGGLLGRTGRGKVLSVAMGLFLCILM